MKVIPEKHHVLTYKGTFSCSRGSLIREGLLYPNVSTLKIQFIAKDIFFIKATKNKFLINLNLSIF
jgi:hypothetical protein